jgi:hypothetical protein
LNADRSLCLMPSNDMPRRAERDEEREKIERFGSGR